MELDQLLSHSTDVPTLQTGEGQPVVLLLRKNPMRHRKHAKRTMDFWKMKCQIKKMMMRKVMEMMGVFSIAISV